MSDSFRIGLFYPTATSAGLPSPLLKEINPDVRRAETHVAVIQAAEAAGLDYVFCADTWGSLGPASASMGVSDPMLMGPILAATLFGVTKRIQIITTMHQLWMHPLIIARMGANLAALSDGRWGMNAVSGAGFGNELVKSVTNLTDHDEFYSSAIESLEIITQLWSHDGVIDFDGKYYSAHGRLVGPMPTDPPVIVSAGASDKGCELAARYASLMFLPDGGMIEDRRSKIAAAGARIGRDASNIKMVLRSDILLAPTQSEANELLNRLLDTVDPEALREKLGLTNAMSTTYASLKDDRDYTRLISGGPEQIADGIEQIYTDTHCDGISLQFAHWDPSIIALFGREVAPLLEKRDIWTPADRRPAVP